MAVLAAVAAAAGAVAAGALASEPEDRALAVGREVSRLAAGESLWPGWDPLATPLAVYDGERTVLFRHPAPPEGFSPLAGAEPPAFAFAGRHPAVTANSSADLGGVATATVLADGPRRALGPAALAAVALHESFHVFQRERHPGWQADEGALLVYPVADPSLLALRRLETEALRRALAVPDAAGSACWAWRALEARGERFAAMEPPFVAYEEGNELNEGLASYVQMRAAGEATVEIPPAGFDATAVRHRAYVVGPALALLLDRFRPRWREALEADDERTLGELLGEALAEAFPGALAEALPEVLPGAAGDAAGDAPSGCGFSAAEIDEIETRARADAEGVLAARVGRRVAFDAAPGWRLVVDASRGEPLWPQGFDPLNLERVEGGLLHTRFVRLGNGSGELEAIDGDGADVEVLTEAAGAHPLFEGVGRAVVLLTAEPRIAVADGGVTIDGPGLTAHFADATVRRSESRILVELASDDRP